MSGALSATRHWSPPFLVLIAVGPDEKRPNSTGVWVGHHVDGVDGVRGIRNRGEPVEGSVCVVMPICSPL